MDRQAMIDKINAPDTLGSSFGVKTLNLLAWTRNKPEKRVANCMRMYGMDLISLVQVRNAFLAVLPEDVTPQSIAIFKDTTNDYTKMMWAITLWLLDHDKIEYPGVIANFNRVFEPAINPKNKKDLVHLVNQNVDAVINLMAWTKKQFLEPHNAREHVGIGVLTDVTEERAKAIKSLPNKVNRENIHLLKEDTSEYQKMMWAIFVWLLDHRTIDFKKVIELFETAQ
jgi:hypothetical protein